MNGCPFIPHWSQVPIRIGTAPRWLQPAIGSKCSVSWGDNKPAGAWVAFGSPANWQAAQKAAGAKPGSGSRGRFDRQRKTPGAASGPRWLQIGSGFKR